MSDHVYISDALHVTPPIPEPDIEKRIADGTYIQVWNDDPRGEPGYLARRPDAVMGVFVCTHHAEDGTAYQAGVTIEADWHLEFTKEERPATAIAAEIAQLMDDFHAGENGLARHFHNVIAYEANTYVGPGPEDYTTSDEVIVIRNGRPVCLSEKEWLASIT